MDNDMKMRDQAALDERKRAGPRHTGARVAISVTLILLILAAGVGVMRALASLAVDPAKAPAPDMRIAVRVQPLELGDYTQTVFGWATVLAPQRATVSARVSGPILTMHAALKEGNALPIGAPLMSIDPAPYQRALDTAMSARRQAQTQIDALPTEETNVRRQLEVAQAAYKLAKERLDNLARLHVAGAATADAVDAQKLSVESQHMTVVQLESRLAVLPDLRAQLDAAAHTADAQIAQAQLNLDYTTVMAPFDGAVVKTLHARAGDAAAAGSPLFTVSGGQILELEIKLPASRRNDIHEGASVRVLEHPGANKSLYTGRIQRIGPGISPQTRTFSAFIELSANAAGLARRINAGELLCAEVDGRTHTGVWRAPRNAEVDGGIFMEQNGAAARMTPVIIARTGEWLLMEIGHGIKPGDRVIISNLDIVLDGTRVRVMDDAAAGATNRTP